MRRHSAGLARQRLAAGAAWGHSGLVVVDELGRGLHPQRLTDLFQQGSDAAGLRRIRLHDLRHTSATLALVAGVHPKIVQERLGHTTISMTLDTYSPVLAGMPHDAAAQVEALLKRAGAGLTAVAAPWISPQAHGYRFEGPAWGPRGSWVLTQVGLVSGACAAPR